MSFTGIKPYFKNRLETLKLKEWQDAFNVDNIPATILDKSFHIELLPATYLGTAHGCVAFQSQVRIRSAFKGAAKPALAVDKAAEYADSIIKECCKSTNRLTDAKLKNILPTSVDIKALEQSNDNVAVLEIIFSVTLYLNPDET